MPGGIADTLLALVWTQYQYFVFPIIFGYLGCKLLYADWRHTASRELNPLGNDGQTSSTSVNSPDRSTP